MSKIAYIDREEASKLLNVSTRTIDRYTRKYKMKTRKDGRRVMIKKTDLDKFMEKNMANLVAKKESNLAEIKKTEAPKVENKLVVKDVKLKEIKEKNDRITIEQQIYKDLYQEVKNELKEKQDRLEAATYRVGQLESQAKHMVPLLDYNKKDRALQEAYSALDQKKQQADEAIITMEEQIRNERMAKWIYLSLVGLLLVAEPILFMLWAFK